MLDKDIDAIEAAFKEDDKEEMQTRIKQLEEALKLWQGFKHQAEHHCNECAEQFKKAAEATDAAIGEPQ